jgi:hypothetical protein
MFHQIYELMVLGMHSLSPRLFLSIILLFLKTNENEEKNDQACCHTLSLSSPFNAKTKSLFHYPMLTYARHSFEVSLL